MKRFLCFILAIAFALSVCNVPLLAEELGDAMSVLLSEDFAFSTLKGKVTDKNGKGLEGVSVLIYNYDESTPLAAIYTNSEGVWQSDEYDVIAGYTYKIIYYLPAYTFSQNNFDVTAEGTSTSTPDIIATPVEGAICVTSDFEYEISGDEAIITKYTGSNKKVIIPNEFEGVPVTKIGDNAFAGASVTNVFLNATITVIENYAFYNCTLLEEITIPDSVREIGYDAFRNCTSLKKVSIPLCIENTGSNIFKGCPLLTAMEVPEGVTRLPSSIFNGMESLKTVTLPDGLASIGDSAFSGCKALEEITIPSSVTTIENSAFLNCTALQTINMSEGLDFIGNSAFYNCTALEKVTLPDSVTNIGYDAFRNCTNLKKINIPLNLQYAGSNIFKGCSLLTSMEVPEGITYLPDNMFNGMESLKSVSLPDSLDTIGDSAFSNCKALEEITIPSYVTAIESSAFSNCTSLKSVTIYESLEHVGTHAFYNCSALEEITLPDSVENIEYNAFYNCANLKKVNIPLNIQYAGSNIFKGCPLLTSMEVPEGITRLPDNMFNGMDQLKTVSLPESLKEIGDAAFFNCKGLEEISLPENLEKICSTAFSGCTGFTSITLPDSVTDIENNAFLNCTKLKHINIPLSIQNAAFNIFYGCSSLTYIAVPEGVTRLPDQMFDNANYLKTVLLPESLEEIGESAFSNCKSLEKVWIGEKVTYIDEHAFYNVPAEFTIHGVEGSCAEEFAAEHGYFFSTEALDYVDVSLSGAITDKDGNGIENVTVTIYDNTNKKYLDPILTDASGKWTCESLKAETAIIVTYYRSGYEFTTSKFNLTTASGETVLDTVTAAFVQGAVCNPSDFEYEIYNEEAVITKYKGSDKKVIIPDIIENLPVTTIEYNAFDRSQVTDVFLNASMKAIESNAFIYCTNLKNITFPEGFDRIGSSAFFGCSALQKVTLPDSVTNIGYDAFRNCTSLEEINIPLNLQYAGSNIFKGCSLLTSMEVPEGITYLPDNMFNGMESLKLVSLPSSLEKIGDSAFSNCKALEEITIPSYVTAIENSAFSNCTSLKSITLYEGLEHVGTHAFYNCSALEEITLPDSVENIEYNAFYNCANLREVNIPLNIQYAGSNIFKGCPLLTSMEVPEGITRLPDNMFNGMDQLKTVPLPESLKEIGDAAFFNCKGLEEIALPEGLEKICSTAFSGCTGFTSITLPDSVTDIENNAFLNCTNLKHINIPLSIQNASYYIFTGCSSLTYIAVPEGVTRLPDQMFDNANYLKTVLLPESLEEIGESAFSNCKSLEKVWIGEKVTYIDEHAFYNVPAEFTIHGVEGSCAEEFAAEHGYFFSTEALDYVDVSLSGAITDKDGNGIENVTVTIYDNTNKKYLDPILTDASGKWTCESLKAETAIIVTYYKSGYEFTVSKFNLTTASGETVLDTVTAAFVQGAVCNPSDFEYEIYNEEAVITKYKGSDKKVIIPDIIENLPVTTIEYNAFDRSQVTDVFLNTSIKAIESNAFIYCTNLKNITFPEGFDRIGSSAFFGCSALQKVTLPDSVTNIGYDAFRNCTSLEEINIPLNLQYAGSNIFKGCSLLTSMEVPEGITYLPDNMFNGMESLKLVSLPSSLEKIGDSAFSGCKALEEITIPSSVTYIENSAFINCTALQTINMSEGLDFIGNSAFYNCSLLEEITLPDSLTNIGYNAFYNCTNLKKVNIPLNIQYAGSNIFKGCPLLTSMEVPEGITRLPDNMFNGMDQLKTVSLPESLKEIGDSAFSGCKGLEKLSLPENLEKICNHAFSGCTNLKWLDIPNSVTDIESYAFYNCASITSFTYPASLENAGWNLFEGCSSLSEVIIPEGVKKIAASAFSNLPNLKTVSLPQSLEVIEENAFNYCENLRFVIVPNNVSEIKSGAFANCDNLRYVTIGSLECELDTDVFYGSDKMFIYCYPLSDVAKYAIRNNVPFTPLDDDITIYNNYLADTEKTRFYTEYSLAQVDTYVPMTLEYSMDEAKFKEISDTELIISFSESVELLESGIVLNGKAVTDYTYDDRILTIPVTEREGKLDFYCTVWNAGIVSAIAELSYHKDAPKSEMIGYVYLEAPEIIFDAPATITESELTISGVTAKSKKVNFSVNGTDSGSVVSKKDGSFTKKLTLPVTAGEEDRIIIKAYLADNISASYERTVTYDSGAPDLTRFMMYHSGRSSEAIDLIKNSDSRVIAPFIPGHTLRFELKFENYEKLGKVYVGSTKNGVISKLEARPTEKEGEYVAEGYFNNDPQYIPGTVNAYFTTYSDPNDYSKPLAKEDLPDVWKNAENEVLEQTENVYRSKIKFESGDEMEYSVYEDLTLSQIRHLILGEPLPEEDAPDLFAGEAVSELVFGFFDDIAINFTKNGVSTATSLHTAENGDLAMMVEDAPGETFWQIVWDNGKQAFQASAISFAGTAAIQYFSPGVSWSNCGSAFGFISDSVGVVMHTYNDMVSVDDALNEINSSTTLTAEQKRYATEQVEKMRGAYLGLNAFRFAGAVASYGLTLAYGPVVGALAGMVFDGIANIIEGYLDDAMAAYVAGKKGTFFSWLIDPSGYIYDVITNKRIEGATAYVYCILFEEDDDASFWDNIPSPDEYGTLWDAGEYSQENPLITDDEGKYAWDVPQGWWRVKCEMAGYETLWSDWLPVPPVQTEVNLGLMPLDMPEEYAFYNASDKTVTVLSKETSGTVCVAAYRDNSLVSLEMKENVSFTASPATILMDKVVTEGADEVKVFVWKDKTSMIPLH